MTIAQALKRVKRIKSDIADLTKKIMDNLYTEVIESSTGSRKEVTGDYNPVEMHAKRREKVVEIANLKNRLMTTNVSTYVSIPAEGGSEDVSIQTLILRLANVREDLSVLRSISNSKPGGVMGWGTRNTHAVTTYIDRYDKKIIDEDIKMMEDWAETLDTILQKVNHTTELV